MTALSLLAAILAALLLRRPVEPKLAAAVGAMEHRLELATPRDHHDQRVGHQLRGMENSDRVKNLISVFTKPAAGEDIL